MIADVVESRTRVLAHELRAVHAATGAPVRVAAAFEDDPPLGWELRVSGSVVVVTRDTRAPDPAAPLRVRLSATDPARLSAPEEVVTLVAPAAEHAFEPAPAALEVVVVDADQQPRAGATVTVHPSSGPDLVLTEFPVGVYRSDERVWTSAFQPLEVRVGATVRRQSIDPTSRVMRVRLVDPT